jgi:hypothetical protein
VWLTYFALWACAVASLSCGPPAKPDVLSIQSAYEREAAFGSSPHDNGLRVLEASCGDPIDGQFLCQVMFLSTDDPNQRLFYDVIALARTAGVWELKSGLCKR